VGVLLAREQPPPQRDRSLRTAPSLPSLPSRRQRDPTFLAMAEAPAFEMGAGFLADDLDSDLDSVEVFEFEPEEIDTDDVPAPWLGEPGKPVPPSMTRKRPRSKIRALVQFDLGARPRDDGKWVCKACEAVYDTRTKLFGHARFCEAGDGSWQCEWCHCSVLETQNKCTGPSGAKTLCTTCSARYRAGHDAPPPRNEDDEWVCERCERTFVSFQALGCHGRHCVGISLSEWQCAWCDCGIEEAQGRSTGPDGPNSLCTACSHRYKAGHSSPLPRDADGNWVCDQCDRKFDTTTGLNIHRLHCDGGVWRCGWCEKKNDGAKGPGPDGPGTLCSACSQRFRHGHTGPPARDASGKFLCDICERAFETIAALGVHRRRCDGGVWRCGWCGCKANETTQKGTGPHGPKTLCHKCNGRYRAGRHYMCDCGRAFESATGLGGHRKHCRGADVLLHVPAPAASPACAPAAGSRAAASGSADGSATGGAGAAGAAADEEEEVTEIDCEEQVTEVDCEQSDGE